MKNLFQTAQVTTPKSSSKKGKKEEVVIDELSTYAALDATLKTVKGLLDLARPTINVQLINHFVTEGVKTHTQPDNFRGVEGDASASCELKKKSTKQVLTEQEIAILTENKISVLELEDRPATFIINPAYLQDEQLIKKVGETLAKIKGMPADFIQVQESTKTTVVSENSLSEVFALSEDKIRELLPLVSTLAVKPQTSTEDLKKILLTLAEQLDK